MKGKKKKPVGKWKMTERAKHRLEREERDHKSSQQSKKERLVRQKVPRGMLRRAKTFLPWLEKFTCFNCESKKEGCKETCRFLELFLLASLASGEAVNRDKMILESEWNPSKSSKAERNPPDDEGNMDTIWDRFETDFRERIDSSKEDVTGDVITALFAGKLMFERIAIENYISTEDVIRIKDDAIRLLGADGLVLTEDRKILKAIVNDRLTGEVAADIFKKFPEDISRRIARAKDKLGELMK